MKGNAIVSSVKCVYTPPKLTANFLSVSAATRRDIFLKLQRPEMRTWRRYKVYFPPPDFAIVLSNISVALIYVTFATFSPGLDSTEMRRRVMPRNKLTIKPADEPRRGDLSSFVSRRGFCVEITLQKEFLMEFASRLEKRILRHAANKLRYKWTEIYSCFLFFFSFLYLSVASRFYFTKSFVRNFVSSLENRGNQE